MGGLDCNLAKKLGKRGNLIDWNGIQHFITNNEFTNSVVLEIKDVLVPDGTHVMTSVLCYDHEIISVGADVVVTRLFIT
jgi:hypothetical protein